MLWGAALYNNGAFPLKNYRFGQAYGAERRAAEVVQSDAGHARRHAAARHFAVHRTAAAISHQPAGQHPAHFRKGRRKRRCNWASQSRGRPGPPRRGDFPNAASARSTAPIRFFSNLQKTRLHDPLLGFMGSNNHPGDYRAAVVRPVMSFTPTTVRRPTPAITANTATRV